MSHLAGNHARAGTHFFSTQRTMDTEVETDVLIVGAGPVGLMSALTLARYGISVSIIDQRAIKSKIGKASGIQSRTQEIFQSMNLLHEIREKGTVFYDVAFWTHNEDGKLFRSAAMHENCNPTPFKGVVVAYQNITEDAFDSRLSELGVTVRRPASFSDLWYKNDHVHVRVHDQESNASTIYKAKYVLGCDGARSKVRSHLGFETVDSATPEYWTVCDCEITTDFPDVRRRCILRSPKGAAMLIPTVDESIRVYTQLTKECVNKLYASKANRTDRLEDSSLLPFVQQRLDNILDPFSLKILRVKWISEYNIQQSYTKSFHDSSRVFLLGDACHRHSPKAAQGMNTGLGDAYNLTWKLALVIRGLAHKYLLKTYEEERMKTAKELISLDLKFSKTFAQQSLLETDSLIKLIEGHQPFTSGIGVSYTPGTLLVKEDSKLIINTFKTHKITPGTRLYLPSVRRFIDSATISLIDDFPSLCRFHILLLPGRNPETLHEMLAASLKPLSRFNDTAMRNLWHYETHRARVRVRENAGINVTLSVVLPWGEKVNELDLLNREPLLRVWRWRLYQEVSKADAGFYGDEVGGVSVERGAVVLLRPDGYVGLVTREMEEVEAYLGAILVC